MDMLDQDLDERVTMDVNGEDNPNLNQWQVIEVAAEPNSSRGLHSDVICAENINSQDDVKSEDSPQITDDDGPWEISKLHPYSQVAGTVTYRVVQLANDVSSDDVSTAQVVTTAAALVSGQQVTQAIIANPFTTTNGNGSPNAEVGPFYVMMSPQDVLQTGQRTLAPRTHQFSPKLEGARTARDERRRATHNEVERRRRDKINNWIVKLSKIVPDCTPENAKQGQVSSALNDSFYSQSKGGILAKACDYIQELRAASARVPEILKENERLTLDMDLLRQQYEQLKSENQALRTHLQQHGIQITTLGSNS